jgi:hypothetical protein
VGAKSDAGNRECNAVLFNALTQHWVLKTQLPQTRGTKIVQQNTRPGTNTFLYYITEGPNNEFRTKKQAGGLSNEAQLMIHEQVLTINIQGGGGKTISGS